MSDSGLLNVQPPFPLFIRSIDPIVTRWEDNGLFTAFHGRRSRKRQGVGGVAHRVYETIWLMFNYWFGLAVLVSLLVLLGICSGAIFFFSAALVWRFLHYRLANWNARTLPLSLERCVTTKQSDELIAELSLIPKTPMEIGEALILERLQREWPARMISYWIFMGLTLLGATCWDRHFGWGDWILSLTMIAFTWCWSPVVYYGQAQRCARSVVEHLTTIFDSSAVNRTSSALGSLTINVFYVPFLVLLIGFEVAFGYLFLHEAARVVLIGSLSYVVDEVPSMTTIEQLIQVVVSLVLLFSLFLAPGSRREFLRSWNNQMSISSNDATRWCTEVFERV